MATTDYVTGTVVTKDWLNDADALVYQGAYPEGTGYRGTPFNFRNKIINGNFDFWQRGTSRTGLTGVQAEYLADRWQAIGSNHTFSYTRQSFTLGQTDVPGEPTYWGRISITVAPAGASDYCIMQQKIEGVRSLAGKTATISFYAKADASRSMSVEVLQSFGTGGSPSSAVEGIGAVKLNLTSSWQKFTVTVSIPSITGKTLGTNANDFLMVLFWFSGGSSFSSRNNGLTLQTGTFDIARVQLEEGSVATPFEERPFETELALCYRYYERNYHCLRAVATYPGGNTYLNKALINVGAGASTLMLSVDFKATKRAQPTMAARYDISDGVDTDVGAISLITFGGFTVFVNNVPAGERLDLNDWYADAEL